MLWAGSIVGLGQTAMLPLRTLTLHYPIPPVAIDGGHTGLQTGFPSILPGHNVMDDLICFF